MIRNCRGWDKLEVWYELIEVYLRKLRKIFSFTSLSHLPVQQLTLERCVDGNVDTISMLFVDCFCRMIYFAIRFSDISFLFFANWRTSNIFIGSYSQSVKTTSNQYLGLKLTSCPKKPCHSHGPRHPQEKIDYLQFAFVISVFPNGPSSFLIFCLGIFSELFRFVQKLMSLSFVSRIKSSLRFLTKE